MSFQNLYTTNTWLISNSTLFFTDRLLDGSIPMNIYSIFDLSKITEAILFSDKILTLPGRGAKTKLYLELKDSDIFDILDASGNEVSKIISSLRGAFFGGDTYSKELLKNINLEELARIVNECFPISYDTAYESLSNAENWANEHWNSTDWEASDWFDNCNNQEMGLEEYEPRFYSRFWSNKEKVAGHPFPQTAISEAYLRSIIYLRISALHGISYSPDSIRIPIVNFINKSIKEKITKYNQLIINNLEERNAQKIKSLNQRIAYNRFEIEVPSALSFILKEVIKENKSKNNILKKSLELRYNKKIENFRLWLSELGTNIKNGNRKGIEEKFKQIDNFTESTDKSILEKFVIDSISSDISISNLPEFLTSLSIKNVTFELYHYFKNRRLIFLKDLYKHLIHVESINTYLDKVFNSSLSESELQMFKHLRGFQKDYLSYT